MNIWLIHLGELLPIDGAVRLFRYGILAEMLSQRGHTVTRWAPTFVHAYRKQRYMQDKTIEVHNKYRIQLLYAKGYQKSISIRRFLFHQHIAKLFTYHANILDLPDIILTSMPTPEMCLAAIHYGKAKQVPVIVDVRDIWPDALIDMSPDYLQWIVNPLLQWLFRANHVIFQEATAIVGISSSYLSWGLSYANRDRQETDRVFYMGYQKPSLNERERQQAEDFWQTQGIQKDIFICCFFGTINHQFDLETVICAAKENLSPQNGFSIQFVFCGDGTKLEYYKRLAEGETHILFPGWVGTAEIATLMSWSSVGLAPYKLGAKMSLPNKPFEYFAGGLPVISSLRSELETIVSTYNCGITYQAGSVADFVKAVQHLYYEKSVQEEMAKNALKISRRYFSADVVYTEMIDYLEEIVQTSQKRQ